jgi:hypothetical protein
MDEWLFLENFIKAIVTYQELKMLNVGWIIEKQRQIN